ncbi:hypothetical protein [Salmonella phage gmqsjt-1]
MSEVKVYTLVMGEKQILNFKHGEEQRLGQFVKYKDYAALETKCAALAEENALIKSAIPEPRDIEVDNDNMDDVSLAEDFGFNHAIELMRRRITETPATDAFLAEVERKAIRKFINSIEHILRDKLSPYDTEEMIEAMRIFLEEQSGEQK